MKILIANDDGIDAPGLALLEKAARRLSDDIWVVAPSAKRTAAGNSLTIARPLTMTRLAEQRYSCSGTPADCVLTAMTWLFKDDKRPDLVLSGVNDGRNVGEDLAYSGTLGVAREATFWGIPAIAFSRVKNAETAESDADHLAEMIEVLWRRRADWVAEGEWLSINLPCRLPAPLRTARIGRDKVGVSSVVLNEDGDVTEIMVPRGRQDSSTPGDENSVMADGCAAINRLKWAGESVLPKEFLDGLASLSRKG
ncbi:5'/3'-nucleotidase SurE [Frigidibacter sp. ROC022]|uniref:5'/3'-nucleotidase SurE n=1 Tax=Frigidibacter sp. ROC022 TaxID=2971796 RepID=UPI00215B353A|nr:5'/3'-nucleotidase SurE [Frigidibacter sp. ROC022]MCR8722753.1 5'/3'-nucleotidase SurE [Frigidibacter sp. ROC022]